MHVIRQRVPFHQLHAVPLTQLPNDSPNPTSHLAEDRAFPILRHPHHVISTIPSDGGLAQGWSAKIAAGFRRKLSGWSVVMTEYTGPGAVVLLARHCPRVW